MNFVWALGELEVGEDSLERTRMDNKQNQL